MAKNNGEMLSKCWGKWTAELEFHAQVKCNYNYEWHGEKNEAEKGNMRY